MAKKLYIETQGCQMNEYDSSRMADLLGESHGLELTTNPEDADVLLLNTCSIREKAQEKVFSELGRWRKLKEARPDVVIDLIAASGRQAAALMRVFRGVAQRIVFKRSRVAQHSGSHDSIGHRYLHGSGTKD